MQVKWLTFVRRDSVDIHSCQLRRAFGRNPHSCLFDCLASRCASQRAIALFDMAARKKPAVKTMMMYQQNASAIWMEHQGRAGDMPGVELVAREGSRSIFEEGQNQLTTFFFLW